MFANAAVGRDPTDKERVSARFLSREKERLKVLFLSIGRLVRFGPDARDGRLTPQKWSEKASSD